MDRKQEIREHEAMIAEIRNALSEEDLYKRLERLASVFDDSKITDLPSSSFAYFLDEACKVGQRIGKDNFLLKISRI